VALVPWRFPKDFVFHNPQPAIGKMGQKGRLKKGTQDNGMTHVNISIPSRMLHRLIACLNM
jgi:hypothetical protein